jgi:MFS family permease
VEAAFVAWRDGWWREDEVGESRGRLATLVGAAAIDIDPLRRYRDFRLLWLGQGVSFFGSMITAVALPYQVYHLTGNNFAVGILGLVEIVPILVLAFVGGALADAVDRRRMVQVTESSLALMSGILIVNAVIPSPQVWILYVAAALMAGLDALQRPSLDALLPRLVSREDIVAAGALQSLRSTVGMIAGPALGGVLIATAGLPTTFAIDMLTFAGSLGALYFMRAVPPPPGADAPSLQGVLDGLRYAASRQDLLGTYLIDMVAMFFGMPMALFPAIAASYGGASVLGLLYAAPAVGSFLATATSGWARKVHRHGLAIVIAATLWGVSVTLFGLSSSLLPALFCLGLAGAADMMSGLFRSAVWNQTIPDHLRGRLAGIELISYSTGPSFGNAEAGLVASLFSVRVSVVSGGLLCIVGTLLLAAFLPDFRSYDNRRYRADVHGGADGGSE